MPGKIVNALRPAAVVGLAALLLQACPALYAVPKVSPLPSR